MRHDTQAAPGTRAIRDKHLGLAEAHHDKEGAGHLSAILVTGSPPPAQRFSAVPQAVKRDCGIGIGAAALIVVSRAKRSLSVSSLSNGAARRIDGGKAAPPPVNRVRRTDSRRTADRHGQSRAENIILSESLRYLHRWPCLFLSTGCDGTSERRQRARINRLKKHIAINQRRAGMPAPYYVDVRESTPELHAHIVAAFPTKAAALDFGSRLERSPTYGSWICGRDDGRDAWQLVHNWDGIFNYLSKEATRTAQVAARNRFRRVPVAHRSGSVSGDRVRPSDALERELVALTRIELRTRTYAARMPVPVAAKPIAAEFCEALKNRPSAAERPMSTAEFPDALKAVVSEAAPSTSTVPKPSPASSRARCIHRRHATSCAPASGRARAHGQANRCRPSATPAIVRKPRPRAALPCMEHGPEPKIGKNSKIRRLGIENRRANGRNPRPPH